jgi:hypothetical protein
MNGDVVSVEKVIPAPAEAIFALLSDASRHTDIDGSGTLRGAKPGAAQHLKLGDTFGMNMQQGFKYSMVNTVIEFEDNRRITWQAAPGGLLSKLVGGRIWRYELEPTDGGTLVRESWDISKDHQRSLLKRGSMPDKTREAMTRTLEKIAELVAEGS